MYRLSTLCSLLLALLITSCSGDSITSPIPPAQKSFSLGKVGKIEDIQTDTEMGLVLMGGSTDVDAAMRWMIARAGGGDFVVIRSSGGDGYNDYLYNLGGLNSVETLLINSIEAANDQGVFETLMNAEALFIAGGDQSQYLKFWEGTKVEEAIEKLISDKLIPIGGTSAGCAIMGEYVYTGENGSIISDEALQNPFDQKLTVRKSTLINHPFLKNTITDQHFSQRDREGRLVGFLARLKEFSGTNPLRAIAVDEKTALVIDKDGKGQVLGQADVYFLTESDAEQAPEQMQTQLPLTWDLGNKALRVAVFRSGSVESITIGNWDLDWKGYWYAVDGKLITN